MAKKSTHKLTNKQMRFVEEYFVDCNASQAALRAGYSVKTAFRSGQENMQKHAVKLAIEKRQKELSEATGVTQEQVIAEYLAVIENSKKLDENGIYVNAAVVKSTLDSLAKHLGMFTEKVEISTDEDFGTLIQEGIARARARAVDRLV